ncbi:MAG: tetratricopeptide repeat protein [Flavobacteriales bacterium]|nr:tetratricopeptide repeat protein [Flavobacteriales bacterium]
MRVLILLLFTFSSFAQNNNQKIAYQYFINGDYDKAIVIYEELNKSNNPVNTYSPYFISLINTNNFFIAEKLAKNLYSKNPQRLNYLVDVIISLKKQEKSNKFTFNLKKLFRKLNGRNSQAIQLANRFLSFEMYDISLEIYERSSKINDSFSYDLQKAQLYGLLGNDEMMVNQYLDFLLKNPNQKKVVFSNIQRFLDNNGIKDYDNTNLVKRSLLNIIKKYPDRYDFNEMLVWLFMQNQQYKLALQQVISLDRRNQNSLVKIFDITEKLLDLEKFKLAIEGLDYIISKGFNSELYITSHINKLFAETKILKNKNENLEPINEKYNSVINEVGKNSYSILLLSNYAHFKAFYMKNLEEAKVILEDAMKIVNADPTDIAECKIQYADIMLLSGNIWDALLFYSQVEKDFKENPIGHTAKFKRAKIAYYKGDFTWAQAQLDVLKASTSKLISNDAMDLSLLIADNYNLDTIDQPMMQFARADLLFFQQKYDEAILSYDSILTIFKGHDLSDEIYFRKYKIYLAKNDNESSVKMLEKIINDFSYEILIDDALYNIAKIYENEYNDSAKAKDYYQKIILNHEGSIYASEARSRFRFLRGDEITEEK